MVTVINSFKQFDDLRKANTVVVDYFATWCPPCKMIAPEFAKLATKYGTDNVVFVKIDVDKFKDMGFPEVDCDISAMPTFRVFKDGEKVGELVGASKEKLEQMVAEHTQEAETTKEEEKAEKRQTKTLFRKMFNFFG